MLGGVFSHVGLPDSKTEEGDLHGQDRQHRPPDHPGPERLRAQGRALLQPPDEARRRAPGHHRLRRRHLARRLDPDLRQGPRLPHPARPPRLRARQGRPASRTPTSSSWSSRGSTGSPRAKRHVGGDQSDSKAVRSMTRITDRQPSVTSTRASSCGREVDEDGVAVDRAGRRSARRGSRSGGPRRGCGRVRRRQRAARPAVSSRWKARPQPRPSPERSTYSTRVTATALLSTWNEPAGRARSGAGRPRSATTKAGATRSSAAWNGCSRSSTTPSRNVRADLPAGDEERVEHPRRRAGGGGPGRRRAGRCAGGGSRCRGRRASRAGRPRSARGRAGRSGGASSSGRARPSGRRGSATRGRPSAIAVEPGRVEVARA